MEPLLVSITEAGRGLGLAKTKAFEAARDGTIPTVELAGKRLVRVRDLEALVDGLSAERGAPEVAVTDETGVISS